MGISLRKLFIQKKPVELFHQGGPGSGFHGHRGRPGRVGGSSREGSPASFRGGYPSSMQEEMENFSKKLDEEFRKKLQEESKALDEKMAELRKHRTRVEEDARRLGLPAENLVTTNEKGPYFRVGNNMYQTGGEYNPKTGKITMYDIDEVDPEVMKGMLAHEVQHSKWKMYHDEYQKQFIEVQRSARLNPDDPKKWLIRMDGSVRNPADKERLWAYDLHEEFLSLSSDKWKKLEYEDGITEYSISYWTQAGQTKSAYDIDRAVDETLAEVARIEATAPSGMKSVPPIWKDLYKRVRKHAG